MIGASFVSKFVSGHAASKVSAMGVVHGDFSATEDVIDAAFLASLAPVVSTAVVPHFSPPGREKPCVQGVVSRDLGDVLPLDSTASWGRPSLCPKCLFCVSSSLLLRFASSSNLCQRSSWCGTSAKDCR